MDLSFQYETSVVAERRAFRANIPGLTVLLPSGVSCPVKDLGVGGVGFMPLAGDTSHQEGTIFTLDLLVSGRLFISKISAKIVRITSDGLIACAFWEVTRHQEERLDRLVLEMQKRVIARHKALELARANAGTAVGGESPGADETAPSCPIRLDSPF